MIQTHLFPTGNDAVKAAGQTLRALGHVVSPKKWQAVDAPAPMLEAVGISFRIPIPETVEELQESVGPNLPWAEDHFQERVSGVPHNPPPSASWWPFAQRNNTQYKQNEKFTHTYPERLWANAVRGPIDGIRYPSGDLGDVLDLLRREPETRQAYVPLWFPEDTGAVHGGRVPCTLGYHFLQRSGFLHVTYPIRSCDYFRHFRDDIYMAARLGQWVAENATDAKPGLLTMHIISLHCWASEREVLPR